MTGPSSMPRSKLCVLLMLVASCVASQAQQAASASAPTPAQRDRAQAQFELAAKHQRGDGVLADRAEALRLFALAAQGGSAPAAYELARHYSGVTGQTVDLPRAYRSLKQAAERGHVPAQTDLAFVYLDGNAHVGKNLASSFRWFGAAARAGSVRASCLLGDFYKHGWGGAPRDVRAAVQIYRKTAHTDDPCASRSQYELYVAHLGGQGARQDPRLAIEWLRKAADAGNPRAQRALGRAYEKGEGVTRDPALARVWLRKSREGVAPHDDHEHDLPSFGGPELFKRLAPFSPQAPAPRSTAS